mmetsp:Transcript_37322/g.101036  ORF Transcript_37322/g.101036 Transcript_37322/m.101036 type:complete len:337 (+) Transcript_37322:491-1501(+)
MPSSCTILEHTSTPRSRSTSAPQDMEEKGAVLDKLNEASLLSWKHKSLFSCNNCGRTFQKDKLPLHQKGCHAQDRTHKIEIMAQGGRLVEGSTMHMFAKVGDGSMSLPLDKPPGWTLHEGQSAGRGVAVSMVAEASNAEKMGVRPGWKLQSIGGVNVYCAADVHAALAEAMRKNQSHIVVKFQGKRGEGAPQCLHLNPMEEPGFCGSKWEMTPNMPPAVEKMATRADSDLDDYQAVVTRVFPEEQAARAGMKPGCCIVMLNGISITNAYDLVSEYAKARKRGDTTCDIIFRAPTLVVMDLMNAQGGEKKSPDWTLTEVTFAAAMPLTTLPQRRRKL